MLVRLAAALVGAGSYSSAIALACAGPVLAMAPAAVFAGAAGAALMLWAVGAR